MSARRGCPAPVHRDPARIPRVLEALRVYWERHPHLRLGQILVNASMSERSQADPFYMEDEVLEAFFERCDRVRASREEAPRG